MKEQNEDAESLKEGAAPAPSGSNGNEIDSHPASNDFHPIKIKGEPLSATIIRERR